MARDAHHRFRRLVTCALVLGLASAAGAAVDPPPSDPLCAARRGACVRPPYVALMSAFPAELAPLLARTQIRATVASGGKTFVVGTLGGVRVVLVRTGIGLLNAEAVTELLLARFDVSAILFSGVAGSVLDIGDVAVPATWNDGTAIHPVDPELLAAAKTLELRPPHFEDCTPVPPDPPGDEVCLGRTPRIVVGGLGESGDPYGDTPAPCAPGGGPVLGCEPLRWPKLLRGPEPLARGALAYDATDMETAPVARIALERGIPFLAFRAVSDGGGDPLGLPGFPSQFFAYYQLAADNAAAATAAFVQSRAARATGHFGRSRARTGNTSKAGAACDWERAASAACSGHRVSAGVTHLVERACRAPSAGTPAAPIWQRAAERMSTVPPRKLPSTCRDALVSALATRAGPVVSLRRFP